MTDKTEKFDHASVTCIALSGGIGGAKLVLGLNHEKLAQNLMVVGNIGDDFEHLGLHISPDLDTLMYVLSGRSEPERGWGLASETWSFMQALERLGGETWFQLGDGDLATHVERTRRLRDGEDLTQVTLDFCKHLGIKAHIIPASSDPVRTLLETSEGVLNFQNYFVRNSCKPKLLSLKYDGAEAACPNQFFLDAIAAPSLEAVIVCPSNPFLSINPILAIKGFRDTLRSCKCPVIAVSPIVGGDAVKGPTAKNLRELGLPVSASAVAGLYKDFIDGFVLDELDQNDASEIRRLGISLEITDTMMTDLESKKKLAQNVLEFARRCKNHN